MDAGKPELFRPEITARRQESHFALGDWRLWANTPGPTIFPPYTVSPLSPLRE